MVFLTRGPEDSLYKGGMYHGKLVFPSGKKGEGFQFSVCMHIFHGFTIVSFFRVPLQAALNIHDHPKWQVIWQCALFCDVPNHINIFCPVQKV